MSKERLQHNIVVAKSMLAAAESELAAFIAAPENNAFESIEKACDVLEDRLRDQAHEDCQGAGNCGLEEYEQEFIVDGIHYGGVLSVSYDRHDKTYYYIDSARFTYEAK